MNAISIPIQIVQGVPEAQRAVAARLYAEVFAEKYRALIGEGEVAERIMFHCVLLTQALAAFQGGRLVGVAGFYRGSHHFLHLRLPVLVAEFGCITGLWRYFLYLCQRKRAPRNELLMDGLVVSAECRGQGVGALLIQAMAQRARRQGCRGLRLSVVDTNARARALYERLGFVALRTRHYRWLGYWIPFSSLTIMRLPLKPVLAARPRLRLPVYAKP